MTENGFIQLPMCSVFWSASLRVSLSSAPSLTATTCYELPVQQGSQHPCCKRERRYTFSTMHTRILQSHYLRKHKLTYYHRTIRELEYWEFIIVCFSYYVLMELLFIIIIAPRDVFN